MSVTWFDGCLALLLLGLAVYQSRREFGSALFDLVMTIAAVHLAFRYAPILAERVALHTTVEGSRALWQAALLPVTLAACVGLGRLIHQTTRWTLDALDPAAGFALGVAVGLVCAHALTRTVGDLWSAPGGRLPAFVERSTLGAELYDFRSLHGARQLLHDIQRRG